MLQRKRIFLGRYDTIEEAIEAGRQPKTNISESIGTRNSDDNGFQ